ncbi:MAG TPA: YbhB/YbcL family Raf kinase inhibitor-like protein [Polyangiaceae bacterium]|nr:MAG: putative kinase inhibitor [Deltaproteobacteria bacterium ADurb.Bin207]HNS99105.1 YbhB/YbcL family Raf kinase inhibitor-like protein [Polyangiaceae bacterium]HNZ21466.1 YbhB/YbcL family Raf kinase inhibitor-like protein [Polyangiaceae bacterium]HOD23783.1 YbhB/YbcL family Raf kinase inhibitor-like protein [Polyangiaceae bacterium]HOE51269.1 YbhB/YbcL family Raf kinase inhibitor-like protein [Polyangiaceae bacterium]
MTTAPCKTWILAAAMLLSACTPKPTTETMNTNASSQQSLQLSSSAFEPASSIPTRYTCEGEDLSPPLSWKGIPEGTQSLVLIVDDPDAPDPAAPKMTWVHWILYDIPPSCESLAEGIRQLPAGTKQGINSWKKTGYGGPCPPIGNHRYFHKLYALDKTLASMETPDKDAVVAAMQGHILAQAVLMGTYQKKGK